jgi:diguanylate cyclase (GGDEF)-like protein
MPGDKVLRHVAAVAQHTIRTTDSLARYGGEEFVIVAPETDAPQTLQLAEHLRKALESSEIALDHRRVCVTGSFGVSMLHAGDEEAQQIINRADNALYAAKANGRNRVVMDAPAPVKV